MGFFRSTGRSFVEVTAVPSKAQSLRCTKRHTFELTTSFIICISAMHWYKNKGARIIFRDRKQWSLSASITLIALTAWLQQPVPLLHWTRHVRERCSHPITFGSSMTNFASQTDQGYNLGYPRSLKEIRCYILCLPCVVLSVTFKYIFVLLNLKLPFPNFTFSV